MPFVSGNDLISEITEKAGRRLIVLSAIVILVKLYEVNLEDLSILGLSLPSELFDLVALCLIMYMVYVLVINWIGDLAAFRLWYSESNIWSEFNTNIKLDKGFISGGTKLLLDLFRLEKSGSWPADFSELSEDMKREYNNFKTNVELYVARLSAAGQQFSTLSAFSRFYIWFQAFLLPMAFAGGALYMLYAYGNISLPTSANGT
jgi:hypothetical protein